MWGCGNSPAGGRGPEEGHPGVGAAQVKGQRQAEKSPCLEAKMLTAHPGPSRSSGACPRGPAVRSCVTRSWPKHRSTALSEGEAAMAGTYPASWPLKWLQLLRGVSSSFPEVPGWDGALLRKASCTDTHLPHALLGPQSFSQRLPPGDPSRVRADGTGGLSRTLQSPAFWPRD